MKYLVGLVVLVSACARPVSLDSHQCPCLDGYVCCPARNQCVPAGQSCTGEDAGPPTPDLATVLPPDLAPALSPDLAEGPNQLTADRWTAMSSVGAPSPRGSFTAVWTGTEVIVWGGVPSVNEGLATGGRYDPATDHWRPMATLRGPGTRGGQQMVWTGKEVVVWGGVGVVDPLATGSRYDPATDSWTPMSTEGAPSGYGCVAIWAGDRMVVRGANQPGASYDPATDRWTPLTSTGAPAAPNWSTATWTGQEVLFFGGVDPGGSPVRAGLGLYDPARDRWRPLPEDGAPGRRYRHSAVFTGREVIVWGGASENAGDVTPFGAAFDVAANRWRPLSPVEQPPGGMAVWAAGAGTRGTGLLLLGTAAYDPPSDRWMPTSPDGPRGSSVAVWTGQDLFVFGSNTSDPDGFPQLARYRP